MNNTFAKKVLLAGAVAVSLSAVVPAHAMQQGTVRERVTAYMQESKASLEKRLKGNMDTLDKQFKAFMKCVKREEPCTEGQRGIIRTLGTITAVVTAMAVTSAGIYAGGELAKSERARMRQQQVKPELYSKSTKAKLMAGEPAYQIRRGYRATKEGLSDLGETISTRTRNLGSKVVGAGLIK